MCAPSRPKAKYFAIIPARYQSSRFPGKPLARILGRPMFWHVYRRTLECPLIDKTWLATDDERIYNQAADLGVPALMTGRDHASGTDRILEAASKLDLPPDSVIANVQGDEPALHPEMLTRLLEPFQGRVQAATLARPITAEEAQDPNTVKVVRSESGRALYFSRSPIPYPGGKEPYYLGHIGLYAYTFETLREFSRLGPSPLERAERLEQLRLLQADIDILVGITEHVSHGVDRPEDIPKIEKILQEK
ncbi:MAG: 3-deoxy-manno-octulosonate cytidylyltransferase [Desulfonatronovibrionaceae bacterium]